VRLARLSGSGPTCFALFSTEAEAKLAAAKLSREHPSWWIVATSLRP
jgi:4-diphosphocytidyl-2-C-methyl-D-erythritol kinase